MKLQKEQVNSNHNLLSVPLKVTVIHSGGQKKKESKYITHDAHE